MLQVTNEDILPLLTADLNSLSHVSARLSSKGAADKNGLKQLADKVKDAFQAWRELCLASVLDVDPKLSDEAKAGLIKAQKEKELTAKQKLAILLLTAKAIGDRLTKDGRPISIVSPCLCALVDKETGYLKSKAIGVEKAPAAKPTKPAPAAKKAPAKKKA